MNESVLIRISNGLTTIGTPKVVAGGHHGNFNWLICTSVKQMIVLPFSFPGILGSRLVQMYCA